MIDPAGGGGSGGDAARAAAEAARRAAMEAARRAAQERARAAAAERLRDQRLARVEAGPFSASGVTPSATARGTTYSPDEVARLNHTASPGLPGGGPAGSDHVPVPVRVGDGATALVDSWLREGKSAIGMASTAVYDAYMDQHGLGLEQMARVLAPETAPSVESTLRSGDTEGYVNRLIQPALGAMADLHPGASFELLAVEHGTVPGSMPGAHQIYAPQTVVRMTENGETQDYVLNAGDLFRPNHDEQVHEALTATSGGLEAWAEAEARFGWDEGGPQATWEALSGLPADGGDYNITLGVMTMESEVQSAFLKEYGQTSDIPLGVLQPIDQVPAEQILVSVDANPLAQGTEATIFATTVHNVAIDGLADSTALPPIGDVDPQQWRATLDQLVTSLPADLAGLRTQLGELTGGTITEAVLADLAADDANALPALLNLVQDRPPEVTFSSTLNLSFATAGESGPATYESISYDSIANVAVVDTSLNRLMGDPDAAARLAETYGVGDLPMTVRIPLPEGSPIDWSSPTAEQLELLNQQVQEIGSASVFQHGFQSDRRVWATDMQRWMDLSPEPTLGIAFAGMGSEGDFLGSGASPLTAKQYAFHTMEALDALGLYGKELNVYGHSMGGAAVLQAGLATDRMVEAGATRPTVNYVLLEPAPTGDSVPFLTEGALSGVINLQTNIGAAGWFGDLVSQGTSRIGSGIVVNHLIPGAPEYIQDVHESFAGSGGFDQLKATGQGLVLQAEPDPAEVRAFLAGNHVLVVAGTQDRIVSTDAVNGIFGGQVFEVPGNHYAHLPSEISEENHFGDVEQRVREFLEEPPLPPAPTGPPGGGGGGSWNVR
jgi:pimeloyl-ACP methyl ester carboxylesterase